MKKRIIKGFVVSILENNEIVETPATLNELNGEIFKPPINDEELIFNKIEEEYFESENGEIHLNVCPICRNFITKNNKCSGKCN